VVWPYTYWGRWAGGRRRYPGPSRYWCRTTATRCDRTPATHPFGKAHTSTGVSVGQGPINAWPWLVLDRFIEPRLAALDTRSCRPPTMRSATRMVEALIQRRRVCQIARRVGPPRDRRDAPCAAAAPGTWRIAFSRCCSMVRTPLRRIVEDVRGRQGQKTGDQQQHQRYEFVVGSPPMKARSR